MKIYKNQDNLQFTFSVGSDITNYSEVTLEIQYPQGSTSSWTCTVSTASTGSFYFDGFTTGSLKTAGTYLMQPKVEFSDGTIAYGETTNFKVKALFT